MEDWGKSIDERTELMKAGKIPASTWLIVEIFVYIIIMLALTTAVAGVTVFLMGVLGKLRISEEDAQGIAVSCVALSLCVITFVVTLNHGELFGPIVGTGLSLFGGWFGLSGGVGLLYYSVRFVKYNL